MSAHENQKRRRRCCRLGGGFRANRSGRLKATGTITLLLRSRGSIGKWSASFVQPGLLLDDEMSLRKHEHDVLTVEIGIAIPVSSIERRIMHD